MITATERMAFVINALDMVNPTEKKGGGGASCRDYYYDTDVSRNCVPKKLKK